MQAETSNRKISFSIAISPPRKIGLKVQKLLNKSYSFKSYFSLLLSFCSVAQTEANRILSD